MVFFNHATRQMTAKIVYYGPGLCGKTTNLNTIYGKTSQKARGEMVSLNTETDRTLFFDLLPMDVGVVGGFKCKLQLYTVPGQVFYNSTRKLVLKGVDGIVFVADSQTPMLDANKESLQNLEDNLKELGIDITTISMVFQWNKRDLKNVLPTQTLEQELNPRHLPSFTSVASDGTGVFETLRGITKLSLAQIKSSHFGESDEPEERAAALPPPAPQPPHPPQTPPQPAPPAAVQPPFAPPLTHSNALKVSDLPSVGSLLEDDAYSPPPVNPRLHQSPLAQKPAIRPAQMMPNPSPTLRPTHLAPPPPLKPRVVLPPKPSVANILGDLTLTGHGINAGTMRLDLPEEMDDQPMEIIVVVRQAGQVLVEHHVKKQTPTKGTPSRMIVELRRT